MLFPLSLEVYEGPYQTFIMKLCFFDSRKKNCIIDILQGYNYASGYMKIKNLKSIYGGALHSFSIKNILYENMDLKLN